MISTVMYLALLDPSLVCGTKSDDDVIVIALVRYIDINVFTQN